MSKRYVCKIDWSVNDDPRSVTALLRRLEHSLRSRGTRLIFDLERCRYLGPDAASSLAATFLHLQRRGQKPDVTWPSGPGPLLSFCDCSGLRRLAAAQLEPHPQFDSQFNVLPIQRFQSARFQDADPVIELVQAHIGNADDIQEYLDYLRICINEVIQNIEDHAKSPIGGVLCARFMRRAKQVRVSILDRGQGIEESLKQKHADTTPENALKRVLKGRYSALSRENNAGLGINHLRNIVAQLGGNLYIISGEARAVCNANSVQFGLNDFCFQGTGVFFSLPVMYD